MNRLSVTEDAAKRPTTVPITTLAARPMSEEMSGDEKENEYVLQFMFSIS